MEFSLSEVLTIIDKVKDTELSLFEYQDADTKIKIKGTKSAQSAGRCGGRKMPGAAETGSTQAAASVSAAEAGNAPAESAAASASLAGAGIISAENAPGVHAAESSAAAPAGADTAAAQSSSGVQGKMIESPMVGTFYASASEGGEPFVRVGDTVKKGQVIGIVEAMKLMNEIESEYSGVVEEIFVENEQMVEYGQPLVRVREQ